MGLDITHDCWHGAYFAFMRWREKIAEAANFPPLMVMEYFYNPPARPDDLPVTGSWACDKLIRSIYLAGHLPYRWADLQPETCDLRLVPLLSHSDCDGKIPHEQCGTIADALEDLLPRLIGDAGDHIDNWQDKTQAFIDGLRAAHEAGDDVEFL